MKELKQPKCFKKYSYNKMQISMKRLYIILFISELFVSLSLSAQKVYSLDECKQMALNNNIKIKTARINIEQAKEQEKEAFSKYFPTVSATGNYFRSNDYLMKEKISITSDEQQQLANVVTGLGLNASVLSALPTSYTLKAINHGTMVNLMAMQPIYAGGQITAGNKLAKLQTQIRTLQLQQSYDDIVNTTEVYYNQLLTLYEKQHTLDVVDKQLKQINQDAENAYKAGISNKNDVLSVELKQNEIAANRLKLENGIKLCKMVLAQYIGMVGEDIRIDTKLPENLPNPVTYLTDHESALNNRVETKLLDKNVEANKLQTRLKRGALLPTVAVGAAGIYQDLSNVGHVKAIGLATVSIPISEWWSGSHSVRHQQLAEQIAIQNRDDNRQLLLIQMQSTYNDLDNAYKQIELAKKSMQKSAENLRLYQDYYHAGTSTMSDLLDAQTKDQQSHDQYTDAVAQYLDCRTAYLIATGRNASNTAIKDQSH
jgi:outer membrane protein